MIFKTIKNIFNSFVEINQKLRHYWSFFFSWFALSNYLLFYILCQDPYLNTARLHLLSNLTIHILITLLKQQVYDLVITKRENKTIYTRALFRTGSRGSLNLSILGLHVLEPFTLIHFINEFWCYSLNHTAN